MEKQVKPIFILGLPRSGTSLLLTILSAHKEIAGMAETWLLLPFMYANKNNGVLANYSHNLGYAGLTDLINNLPGKEQQYNNYLRMFFDNLYSSLANSHKYFIDKTPRYYYIIPELVKLYPDAKFIFLFRNPIQIFASRMNTTHAKNRFSIFSHQGNYFDMLKGPKLLSKGYEMIKDKAFAIHFEQFVKDPEQHIKEMLNYLELDYNENMLSDFDPTKLPGRLLDSNVFEYGNTIQKSVTEKWKKIFNTRFRKRFIAQYISNINDEILNIMGYNKAEILNDIKNLKTNGHSNIIKDIMDIYFLKLKCRFNRYRYS